MLCLPEDQVSSRESTFFDLVMTKISSSDSSETHISGTLKPF
jgi:hypothetical protein